uniref:Uncharacterized protein n=1 Tax=Tanacetum cinerariifolium TaxID=118510 RepID=A0A699H452_TANCI|nr:hypothetical protein [Tanacetum cinerariifolium]
MGALVTIQKGNKCTEETKAKADVFLHQHIDEMLEFEYSNCDNPSTLWKDLEIGFNNQMEVLLPSARDEWNNLRFYGQTVTEGDMLEKTFSTFHASNINLQQQYRLQNFKRYSDLNKFKINLNGAQYQAKDEDLCIADSGATHTILKSKKYFFELKPTKETINIILGPTNLVDGVGKANIVLPNGTQLLIESALFSPKSKRNLLSFRNIYHNGYDIQSRTIGNKKYLLIMDENQAFETLPMLYSNLHCTHINVPQAHMAVKEKYCDPGIFSLWHDRLGYPGSTMMKRIVENTHGHPLKDQKFFKMDKVPLCTSCSLGKLIVRPSQLRIKNELPMFLKRIQVYVPITPPQRIKMGPQRRLGIYVGYETSFIIRYIKPLTGDVFTARFADCHFNEVIFPLLGGEKKTHEKYVSWSEPSLLYLDPCTKQSETEVQKIMHLQEIANQ